MKPVVQVRGSRWLRRSSVGGRVGVTQHDIGVLPDNSLSFC